MNKLIVDDGCIYELMDTENETTGTWYAEE